MLFIKRTGLPRCDTTITEGEGARLYDLRVGLNVLDEVLDRNLTDKTYIDVFRWGD